MFTDISMTLFVLFQRRLNSTLLLLQSSREENSAPSNLLLCFPISLTSKLFLVHAWLNNVLHCCSCPTFVEQRNDHLTYIQSIEDRRNLAQHTQSLNIRAFMEVFCLKWNISTAWEEHWLFQRLIWSLLLSDFHSLVYRWISLLILSRRQPCSLSIEIIEWVAECKDNETISNSNDQDFYQRSLFIKALQLSLNTIVSVHMHIQIGAFHQWNRHVFFIGQKWFNQRSFVMTSNCLTSDVFKVQVKKYEVLRQSRTITFTQITDGLFIVEREKSEQNCIAQINSQLHKKTFDGRANWSNFPCFSYSFLGKVNQSINCQYLSEPNILRLCREIYY